MTSRTSGPSGNTETNRILARFVEELGEPIPALRTRRASNRVLENLASIDGFVEPASQMPAPMVKRHWGPVAAVAAGLCAVAVLVGTLSMPSSAAPIAKRLSGKLIAPGDNVNIGEGKLIRTEDSGGEVLELRDGSRMEMSSGVELSINSAADGIQIDLAEGNIIVTAAKQRKGHLYVKTRDCMVSVVGTVFSVKAEATGSRIAVIEGEVHVQHGDVSQTLLPGQQVATNAEMKTVPLQSEIGWSQDPAVQVAMLQQAPTPAASAAPSQPMPATGNADLVGEIRLILAPVDQGLTRQLGQISLINWAAPANGFSFAVTGIQGRTVSFSNSKGETFSYGCPDCSFVVSENGVSKVLSTSEPGVEFKLNADGSVLTGTCHASQCLFSIQAADSKVLQRGVSEIGGAFLGLNYSTFTRSTTFTIPISQLVSQQGGSVILTVTKPAGQ
jgi:ferric-dicitrate binding protein FerR (iron transport regulator)